MKGILLLSHGDMAKGMADSAKLFFGEVIEQMDYLCLHAGDSSEEFAEQLCKKVNELDYGDGVVMLVDLYGGTPCNQAIRQLYDNLELISGMNFAMLVQLLAERVCVDLDVSSLIEAEKAGITNVKKRITEMVSEEDWL